MKCNINEAHCESCGSTSPEDLGFGGYSSCCNELVTNAQRCRDHHGEEARYQAALDAAVEGAGFESRYAMIEAVGLDEWDRFVDAATAGLR